MCGSSSVNLGAISFPFLSRCMKIISRVTTAFRARDSPFFRCVFVNFHRSCSQEPRGQSPSGIDEGAKFDRERRAVGIAGTVSGRLLLPYFPERRLEGNFSSAELKLAPARNAYGIFNSMDVAFLPCVARLVQIFFETGCLTFS